MEPDCARPMVAYVDQSDSASNNSRRRFIQSTGRLAFLAIQEFRQCRDGLLAAIEPSFGRQDRELIAFDKLARQLEQRELVCGRVSVECVSHLMSCSAKNVCRKTSPW